MAAWRRVLVLGLCAALAVPLVRDAAAVLPELGFRDGLVQIFGDWVFPLLIGALLIVGLAGRVRIYESAIEGGREGLTGAEAVSAGATERRGEMQRVGVGVIVQRLIQVRWGHVVHLHVRVCGYGRCRGW